MRLTKRETTLIIIVLLVGISFLYVNYVYFPLQDESKELEAKYNELLIEESDAKVLVAKTTALKAELKEIEDSTIGVYDGMVEIWDQAENLVYMEKLFEGLSERHTFNSYTPLDVSSIRTAEIDMSIVTNYTNLQRILNNLEDGKNYCTIESLNIVAKSRGNENPEWEPMDLDVNLTVRFYAKGQSEDYPNEYDFMSGSYGKRDIFLED